MIDGHFLQHTNLSAEANKKQLIYENMVNAFNQQNRLLVLLDETLAPNVFDDLKINFKFENIIYLPLAKGNSYKDTNLFFIEIVDKKILEKVWDELAEHLLDQFDVSNDHYLVHGFGTSQYDNEELNKKFKKSLVLDDIESKILFRWYDPRVMIYLDDIFDEYQMNSLLGNFTQWQFTHPSGYFQWEHISHNKLPSKAITKINEHQSLALDLVEIGNIVFRKSHQLEQIDVNDLKPHQILRNLYQGHEQYEITKYVDLVSYGLYAEVLGRHFMVHPYIQEVLQRYWNIEPENYNFTEAMEFVSEEYWVSLKKDLKQLEDTFHG